MIYVSGSSILEISRQMLTEINWSDKRMLREMSLDLFGEMFPAFAPRAEDKRLAAAIVKDARKHAARGDEQQKYAQTARNSIARASSAESRRELARIAVWHYETGAENFRRSAIGFESASRLQTSSRLRRALLLKAKAAERRAAEVALAISEIEDFGGAY